MPRVHALNPFSRRKHPLQTDQFDMLYEEGRTTPRVMAICLHPFAVTAPSRSKYLRRSLEHILGHSGVWQATGGDIADWYYANYYGKRVPAPALEKEQAA